MAQHDLTNIAAQIKAATGSHDQLLAIPGVEATSVGIVAWNVRALAAANQLAERLTARAAVATTHTTGHATYTKHRGDWAVTGPAELIVSGATVTVSRRDGSTSEVVINTILGTTSRGTLAAFTKADRRPTAKAGTCSDCGRRSDHLREAVDSSGIHGYCCYRCIGLDAVERSFA